MGLTTRTVATMRYVVDETSLERAGGHLIDWDSVTNTNADGTKHVEAGTVVSRTSAGLLQPRAFSVAPTSIVVSSNVATVTLVGHGFSAGEYVTISGANESYVNGTFEIASVPDADTFTYATTGADATATGTIAMSRRAVGILETDATQNAPAASLSGYGLLVGGVLYETLLPDATGSPLALPAAYKTELTAAGCTFKYVVYADSRAS
jgi:hypothetical protein